MMIQRPLWTFKLIEQANLIGSKLIVFHYSSMPIRPSSMILLDIELYAANDKVQIALETCEDDYPFNIVYDTGNRVMEGINLANDIKRLAKRIVHVHIKDKDLAW